MSRGDHSSCVREPRKVAAISLREPPILLRQPHQTLEDSHLRLMLVSSTAATFVLQAESGRQSPVHDKAKARKKENHEQSTENLESDGKGSGSLALRPSVPLLSPMEQVRRQARITGPNGRTTTLSWSR